MPPIWISLALIALLASVSARAKDFTSSDVFPADYPTVRAVAHMGGIVRERTSGRHTISVLGQDDRDSENYAVGQIRNGSLDMARVNLAVLNNIVPSTVILSLPYLFKSVTHMRSVLDGLIGDDILADMESSGIIGLCFHDTGARSYTAKKPIRNVADMKGLKVRIQQSDISATIVRAMGAVPVTVPSDRIYRALQTGVIDVVENTLPSYSTSRHHQVARFYSLTEHSMAPSALIFSKRVWDELSADDQAILRAAAKESVSHLRQQWQDYEILSRMGSMASGAQIVTDVDKQSFIDVLRPLYPTLVAETKLQNVVRRIQAAD
jgi:tripartite ATP-independent transporter DctP family solute receptor